MKIRLSIWLMLAVAAAMVALAIWHRHPVSSPSRSVTQAPATSVHPATISQSVSTPITPRVAAPVAAQPEPSLSSTVQVIVDEQAGYLKQEEALHALPGKLADADREALYAFLRQHYPSDDGQLGQVLKNELLDRLCQMEPPPPGLRDLLTQIYQDPNQNIVLRDYAVQHVSAFYRQMAMAPGMDSPARNDELNQAQRILWAAVNDTDSSISGTAMLGLSQLSQGGWPGLDADKIGSTALKLAGDNNAGELTRITAFQVCANLGVKDALGVVWVAAQQGDTESVRISAIAALGALGGAGQLPFLNDVLQGDDERLKPAAQGALNRIEQRLRTTQANARG
jgi:hypothetical protein